MRYLDVEQLLRIHREVIEQTGGSPEIRDRGLLESAAAQPQAGFGGVELYPTITDKASALGFSLICNHPCVDGNKRLGSTAMRVFLLMNGYEIDASVDEREHVILSVAAGQLSREQFTEWLRAHIVPATPETRPP